MNKEEIVNLRNELDRVNKLLFEYELKIDNEEEFNYITIWELEAEKESLLYRIWELERKEK